MIDSFALSDAFHDAGKLVPPVGREDSRNRPSNHLFRGVSEYALRASIPAGDNAVEILAENRVVRGLDDRNQKTAGFVGPPPGGDIPEYQHRSLNSAALATNGRTTIVDRNLGSVVCDQDGVVRHADNSAFPQYPRHRALHFLAAELIHDLEDLIQLPADGLGFLQPQHRLGDGVDKDHAALCIRGYDCVSDTGERGTKRVPHFLTFFQGRLLRQERISEVAVLRLEFG